MSTESTETSTEMTEADKVGETIKECLAELSWEELRELIGLCPTCGRIKE